MSRTQLPAALADTTYVRVTTFRKDGTPVHTPVWNAPDGADLVFTTGPTTGKVKRLAHTALVRVAPCDARGQVKDGSQEFEGSGEVIRDAAGVAHVQAAIKSKYGFQVTMIRLLHKLRGKDKATSDVAVRVRFAAVGGAPTS